MHNQIPIKTRVLTETGSEKSGLLETNMNEQALQHGDVVPIQETIDNCFINVAPNNKAASRSKEGVLQALRVTASLVVVCALAYYVYGSTKDFASKSDAKPLAPPPPTATVTLSKAEIRPMDDVISVTGSVSPWDELKVGVEVSGLLIHSVNVEEGDHVKKGQVIATLSSQVLQAQLEEAKAKLSSSLASFDKSLKPNRPEEIAALEAALEQAQSVTEEERANLKKLKMTRDHAKTSALRFKELYKVGAISAEDNDTKQITLEGANLDFLSAEHKVTAATRAEEQSHQKLLQAKRGGRSEDIQVSQATINENKAAIKHLQAQLDQTIIRAPDDGIILHRDAHIGDATESTKPLFTMIRHERLELRAQVNDLDVFKFKPGQTVSISTKGTGKGCVVGKVSLVSPAVDAVSRLATVRIALPPDCGLKPGMFVRGEITLSSHKALTVPAVSLIPRGGESLVFTVKDNRAVGNRVETGVQTDKFVEIKSGLKEGELVVTKGVRFLSDHDLVDVLQ